MFGAGASLAERGAGERYFLLPQLGVFRRWCGLLAALVPPLSGAAAVALRVTAAIVTILTGWRYPRFQATDFARAY